ncbi:NAD(P)/FAD-dependent oxidoreductase [Qipengyuania nanhaisediminis]|uniref:NAD(P)/FAD-dependent oxidoreductase n=1 Tax=Qipengyuania nanhaisediminis TaxID=604088 RepID=UPI0038B2C541
MDDTHSEILVIGGGMAGLACASALREAGCGVRVLDKGRGPGGRMAARRAEIDGQEVGFDHGAQYFTARDEDFRATVAGWAGQGVVAPWPAAGDEAWIGTPGMNAPLRAMAQPLDMCWGVRAESFARENDGRWRVTTGDEAFTADNVLVAVPAEQAAALLEPAAPDLAAVAAGVHSQPCWAVMAGFDARLEIDSDTVQSNEGPVAWAARNSAKPARAGSETWVIHASPARSREIIDLSKDEAARVLLGDFVTQTGIAPVAPIHLAAHRWLYARPEAAKGAHARFDPGTGIGIAGDYLHSPRVEGAWLSGRALAREVIAARR